MIPRNPVRTMRRSIPGAVAVALLAGVVAAHPVVAHWGRSAYEEQAFASSANRYEYLERVNVYEQYRAPFNRGTALMQDGQLADARDPLVEALELAPQDESCQVRFNLVLTIERQGDRAVREMNATTAVLLYEEALELIAQDDCERPSTPDEHEQLAEAQARIEEKLRQLQPEGEPPPPDQNPPEEEEEEEDDDEGESGGQDDEEDGEDGGNGGESSPQPPDNLEERLDELQERNQESTRSGQDLRDEREFTEDGNDLDYGSDPMW